MRHDGKFRPAAQSSDRRAISRLRTVDGRQHLGLLAVQHSFGLLRLQEVFIDALLCVRVTQTRWREQRSNKPQCTLQTHLHCGQRAAHDLDDLQRPRCLDGPAKQQTMQAQRTFGGKCADSSALVRRRMNGSTAADSSAARSAPRTVCRSDAPGSRPARMGSSYLQRKWSQEAVACGVSRARGALLAELRVCAEKALARFDSTRQ